MMGRGGRCIRREEERGWRARGVKSRGIVSLNIGFEERFHWGFFGEKRNEIRGEIRGSRNGSAPNQPTGRQKMPLGVGLLLSLRNEKDSDAAEPTAAISIKFSPRSIRSIVSPRLSPSLPVSPRLSRSLPVSPLPILH